MRPEGPGAGDHPRSALAQSLSTGTISLEIILAPSPASPTLPARLRRAACHSLEICLSLQTHCSKCFIIQGFDSSKFLKISDFESGGAGDQTVDYVTLMYEEK